MKFEQFKSVLKGDLVTPEDASYPAAIARWAVNAQRKAKYVVFVKDADDVAAAIKFARANDVKIAIKGGGHSPSGGSSQEGGLVIDLSKYMNQVRVDTDKKLAYVGGGALWSDVDNATIQHGLATVAGTVCHTGVAGLTLGGGYGWLSAAHGLSIDTLVGATIVIADGSTLTLSESSNSDLFWAIRGGGSNFGVVTEFIFKVYEQRRTVWAGLLIYPPPLLEALIDTAEMWWSKGLDTKQGAMVALGRSPDGQPAVLLVPFYNGSAEEGRAAFKAFLDLGPVADMTNEIPFEMLNTIINPSALHGRNVYMKGVSQTRPSTATAKAVFEQYVSLSADPDFYNSAVIFEYMSLDKIRSVPHDATAFRSRGPQANVLVNVVWGELGNEEKAKHGRQMAQTLGAIISGAEAKPTESENAGYGNYESEERVESDKTKVLFGENYPRLQKIKARYDPDLVFSKWFPIQPKA